MAKKKMRKKSRMPAHVKKLKKHVTKYKKARSNYIKAHMALKKQIGVVSRKVHPYARKVYKKTKRGTYKKVPRGGAHHHYKLKQKYVRGTTK